MFFKPFLDLYKRKRVYLDYASSTPLDHKMLSTFPKISKKIKMANPSALHKEGVELKKVLSGARVRVARTLNAHPEEIIFTSGATESDNLAISGLIKNLIKQGFSISEMALYTSPFEHSAVSESVININPELLVCTLTQEDGQVITKNIVVPEKVKVLIVSVIFVQNETGSVQPIKEISKHLRKLRKQNPELKTFFHVDATQAPLFYDLSVNSLGIDMMTLGATKLYCNKGVGLLYKKRGTHISPIMYGGGQEFGIRPGTEAVSLIDEFSYALEFAQTNINAETEKIKLLQKYFESKLKESLPKIRITNSLDRAPHISHLVIPEIESELLVIELDAKGVAVSSKSACKNEDSENSEILKLFYPNQDVGAIRISYGRMTTKRQLKKTVKALKSVLSKYKI